MRPWSKACCGYRVKYRPHTPSIAERRDEVGLGVEVVESQRNKVTYFVDLVCAGAAHGRTGHGNPSWWIAISKAVN